ncbi:MAG TPA: cupin domain-containing protein [Candidatus Acidoferrum sp.]|nr:cupin domain-containing protein [Candidatus Acidoferrum sp.]
MPKPVLVVDPVAIEGLELDPINPDWILSGEPVARTRKVATSGDWAATLVVWDCTPGAFHWRFNRDESIYVLTGEAFMTTHEGEERRFAEGDLGYFPAGFCCNFRVTKYFRKVAVLRETMWSPLSRALKGWNKLCRMAGLERKPVWPQMVPAPLALPAAIGAEVMPQPGVNSLTCAPPVAQLSDAPKAQAHYL